MTSLLHKLTDSRIHVLLKENKPFLKSIQSASTSQMTRLLSHSSTKELELLLYIIHLQAKGRLPMKRVDHSRIKRSKQMNKIISLKYNEEYLKLVDPVDRQKLMEFLVSVKSVLHVLMNPFFKTA